MLKGLEIEIILKSELQKENEIFRIDSEFQLKLYLESINKVKKRPFYFFDEIIEFLTDGKHGGVTLTEKGVVFLRTTNIQENKIDLSDLRYISSEESNETLRAEFQVSDLLLTTIGTIGLCVKVPKDFPRATINQNLVRIVLKNNEYSSIICCFLNSKFGRHQTLRFSAGNVYQMINYPNLRKILIPKFSNVFSNSINKIYTLSESKDSTSKKLYQQAEDTLMFEISLQNFKPSKEAVNIKSFKESFLQNDRIDSEYYQIKYDILESAFDKFKRKKLSEIINYPVSSGVTPKAGGDDYSDAENGVPFIRAVDLKNGEVCIDNLNYIKPSIHNGILKRTKLKQNDVLLSIAGTVGRSAIFSHNIEANINQAVAILRFDEIEVKRLYLVVFFNTEIGKEFVSKYSRQGVQTNLNLSEVGNLSIPILDFNKQEQITELVEESFKLRAESERLLDVAKKAVEIAIEEGEEKAMDYIKKN